VISLEKNKFEEIIKKLKYDKDKWLLFHEIDNIILFDGRGAYPNWKYLKFLISGEKEKILIKHGQIKPYGARLNGLLYLSGDLKSLTFSRTNMGINIESSSFYNEWFRQPRIGDYIRATDGTIVYGESPIMDIVHTSNSIILILALPLNVPINARVSFYDYSVLSSDRENCIHSTFHEGIYMHFIANEGKIDKKIGIYHEEIRIKDIKEINLKIGKDYFNKTYKLE